MTLYINELIKPPEISQPPISLTQSSNGGWKLESPQGALILPGGEGKRYSNVNSSLLQDNNDLYPILTYDWGGTFHPAYPGAVVGEYIGSISSIAVLRPDGSSSYFDLPPQWRIKKTAISNGKLIVDAIDPKTGLKDLFIEKNGKLESLGLRNGGKFIATNAKGEALFLSGKEVIFINVLEAKITKRVNTPESYLIYGADIGPDGQLYCLTKDSILKADPNSNNPELKNFVKLPENIIVTSAAITFTPDGRIIIDGKTSENDKIQLLPQKNYRTSYYDDANNLVVVVEPSGVIHQVALPQGWKAAFTDDYGLFEVSQISNEGFYITNSHNKTRYYVSLVPGKSPLRLYMNEVFFISPQDVTLKGGSLFLKTPRGTIELIIGVQPEESGQWEEIIKQIIDFSKRFSDHFFVKFLPDNTIDVGTANGNGGAGDKRDSGTAGLRLIDVRVKPIGEFK